jgi:glutaredoxin
MRLVTSIGIALLLGVAASAADVYKWTGADGRVHFGDRPPPASGSEQLRIRSFRGGSDVETSAAPRAAVVMLSTVWCGVCKQARQYLAQRGVPFTELDVEKTEAGRAEYQRLAGRGVPIILVGDQRLNGFNAGSLESLLKASGY